MKATDSQIVFVNILGESYKICEDETVTDRQLEISLNSLYDKTTEAGKAINANGDSFYKFKDTKTVIFATQDHLYCKLAANGTTYKII